MWSLIPSEIKAIAVAFGAVVMAFITGAARGRYKQRQAAKVKSVQDVLDAKETEDEIQNLPADERRRRLDGWMRDD